MTKRWLHKYRLLIRTIVAIFGFLCLFALFILLYLYTGRILQGDLLYILPIFVAVLSIVVSFLAWLFPLSPARSELALLPLPGELERLGLGDDTAANFPFIIPPIQQAYDSATQALVEVSKGTGNNWGILIFGETNAGKTRLAYEVLTNVLPRWPVLECSPDYSIERALTVISTKEKRVVLFIDDLQEYAFAQVSDDSNNRLQVPGPRATKLRELVKLLRQETRRTVIVATYRSEDKSRVQATLHWLLDILTPIDIPLFSKDPQNPQVVRIIDEFQEQGSIHIEDWDGKLGSLVLGLSKKKELYSALPPQTAKVLQAMKLLTIANTAAHTAPRLREVCAGVFAEKRLLSDDQSWEEAVDLLTKFQFVRDVGNQKSILVICKDSYFDQVITDYPPPHRPHKLEQDLLQLQHVLINLDDADALANLGATFNQLGRYREALAACENALKINRNHTLAWFFKGYSSSFLELYEDALEACERVLSLDPDNVLALGIWFLKSHSLLELKRYSEALTASERALALDPDFVQAWWCKGNALAFLGRFAKALQACERALGLDPENPQAWWCKGYALLGLGCYSDALAACEYLLSLKRGSSAAWFCKSMALAGLGRYDEAKKALDRSWDFGPNGQLAMVGAIHVLSKDYAEALDACERFLEINPDDVTVWRIKAGVLANLGNYADALSAYEHARQIHPDDADWREKGRVLYAAQRYNEALDACEHALEIDPNDDRAYFLKACAHEALGHYDEALTVCERGLEIDSAIATPWLFNFKVRILVLLGHYDEALDACEYVLALNPNFAAAWVWQGLVLTRLQRHKEALDVYERVHILDPKYTDAWANKGFTLIELECYGEALDACESALALDPNHAIAWTYKGIALAQLERYDESLNASDRALELNSNDVAWTYKGLALVKLRRYDEALTAFDHSLTLNPGNGTAWTYKGAAFIALGNDNEALTAFNHALTLDPNNAAAWQGKSHLLYHLQRFDEAQDACEGALDLNPTDMFAWVLKSRILVCLERYEDALDACEHALALNPNNAIAWRDKSQILHQLGRSEEAVAANKRAVAFDSNTSIPNLTSPFTDLSPP